MSLRHTERAQAATWRCQSSHPVLLSCFCSLQLIDNDKERNKAREAMAALRRAQRAREQQEKQRQEKLGVPSPHGASGTSTAASRGGSSSSIEAQRTQVPTTAAVRGSGSTSQERGRVLLEPTVASRKGSESGGLPGSLLLASNRIEGRILPESTAAAAAPQKDSRSSRSTPLIEELPAPGLELRGPKGGSEPADNTPCSLCGRGGVPGGAQATTRLGSEGASLGGHEARRQQVWMAFPVSGPADGTRAPGFFFLAPQAVVQEQLKRGDWASKHCRGCSSSSPCVTRL